MEDEEGEEVVGWMMEDGRWVEMVREGGGEDEEQEVSRIE